MPPPPRPWWGWLRELFGARQAPPPSAPVALGTLGEHESRAFQEFSRQYGVHFRRPELLKLALTHRSYLSISGQTSRDSNERLEFLGDSILGLVTSEFLYREHPTEHEGQLTKTKSLLVSKAILSRRALAMGLGKFVLMSHSEIESGGRQRLSILADGFESVVGAIYLDQGFEAAREFIMRWLLRDSKEIVADKRHTNYKSHLQEYVQSTFRTHPVYRIRSEMGPDHSKQFNVDVLVGRRVLGSGRGRNKKEAEQAAARNALEEVETRPRDDADRRSRRSGGSRSAEPTRAEPVRAEPVRAEPTRAEPTRAEPTRAEPTRAEPTRAEPTRAEPTRAEPTRAEPTRAEPTRAEPRTEPPRAEPTPSAEEEHGRRRRGRRGGQGRRRRFDEPTETGATPPVAPTSETPRIPAGESRLASEARERPRRSEPFRRELFEEEFEEVGRPEGPFEAQRVDPYGLESRAESQPIERADEFETDVPVDDEAPERQASGPPAKSESEGPPPPRSGERDRPARFGRRPGRRRG